MIVNLFNVWPFRRAKSKWPLWIRCPQNLEAGSAVIYNARRISYSQSHAICLCGLDCRKIIACRCLKVNRKLISCSSLFECKNYEEALWIQRRKLDYKFNKRTELELYLNFRNPAKKMKPRRGHLCFDLVAARHNETLGERIESAHDFKTDETARSLNYWPNRNFSGRTWTDSLFCSASASPPHEGMFSLVKRCHMTYHVKITTKPKNN